MDGNDSTQRESLGAWFSHHKAIWITPVLGILLGALVAYFVRPSTDSRLAYIVGALVTVLATCIGLAIKIAESENRIAGSQNRLSLQIAESKGRISSQTRNLMTLNALAELPESLQEETGTIVSEGQRLKPESRFSRVAITSVSEAAAIVKNAANGTIQTAPNLWRQLVACCEQTENTIRAVSFLKQDFKWWNSIPGKLYFAANVAAIEEREVSITRIFIDDEACPEEEVRNLINRHKKAKVECFVVPISANAFHKDVTIFDEAIAHELNLDQKGESQHAHFYNKRQAEDAVKRIQMEFDELKDHAKQWTGKLYRPLRTK